MPKVREMLRKYALFLMTECQELPGRNCGFLRLFAATVPLRRPPAWQALLVLGENGSVNTRLFCVFRHVLQLVRFYDKNGTNVKEIGIKVHV